MPRRSSNRQYAWPRYWTAPGQNIDDGFFPDESSSIFARTTESHQLAHLVEDPCLVLLGEPGLGKLPPIAKSSSHLIARIPHP
jgi:hypothetical protein